MNTKYKMILICCLMIFMAGISAANATPFKAPEKIKAVMVGDRLVDIAFKLGVLPEGMSVRASMWPLASKIKAASQLLGCPNCVTKKHPDAVPGFMKARGLTRLIIEKSHKFCLYKKKVDPVNVAALVKDVPGIQIEYVDFTKGVVPAIHQTAKLLGKEAEGRALAAKYEKAMKKVESTLPKQGLGKKVLVLKGAYFAATGKVFVRVEAAGGYTDQYILNPLGCTNVASGMLSDTMRVNKGHFNGGRLGALAKVKPDVIVATGNGFAVQLALRKALKKNPALAEIPAIKNGAIYSLPFYGDSSIMEYPAIFNQWKSALEQ